MDKAVLPEIFLKVMEVKKLLESHREKTVQDAVNNACEELGVTIDELNYEVISETKTLFIKKATIE